MIHLMMPAALENVHKAHKIRIDISVRILEGITHTGLRRQVHHPIDLMGLKQRLERIPVLNARADLGVPITLQEPLPTRVFQ
jgi:hypothetical protein